MEVTKNHRPNRRLIRTVHAVQTASFLYCLMVIGLHLWTRGASPVTWALLVLQFVIYPHLVYLRAVHSPDVQERLAATGTEPRASTPEEFGDYIREEMAKWAKVVREAGLRAD